MLFGKNFFIFLLCLAIFEGGLFAVAHYIDKKHPFKPDLFLAFAHIEISVERPLEIEFERPSPTIFGPDFV